MAQEFFTTKIKGSGTRRLPFLPRIGISIEIGGKRYCYRYVPFMETVVNLLERGPSLANLQKIVQEQLAEVRLDDKPEKRTVDVTAKTISSDSKSRKNRRLVLRFGI